MEQDFIIKTDGTSHPIVPQNGTVYSIEELQEIVGGHFQIVYIDAVSIMIVKEALKIECMPINDLATTIFRVYNNSRDFIVGNVLWCQRERV